MPIGGEYYLAWISDEQAQNTRENTCSGVSSQCVHVRSNIPVPEPEFLALHLAAAAASLIRGCCGLTFEDRWKSPISNLSERWSREGLWFGDVSWQGGIWETYQLRLLSAKGLQLKRDLGRSSGIGMNKWKVGM